MDKNFTLGADDTRLFYETRAKGSGYKVIAGIDEAGRGPLAGPVVAAAVVVHDTAFTEKIDDSKKLSAKRRERAFIDILRRSDVGIGVAQVAEIDKFNILNATMKAMERAVGELRETPDYLLIDGKINIALPQERTCLISGESKSVSIASASIIAKVFRDRLMLDLDAKYPQYGFSQHKGYGTKKHIEMIREHGLSLIHRKTFGPFGSKEDYPN